MTASIQTRDAETIAGIQKLRFFPHSIVAGQGAWLIEEDGRRLLDLSASWGAASLGYAHPALQKTLTAAIGRQPGASILSAVNQPAVELAVAQVHTNADLFRMPIDVQVTTTAGVETTRSW